jgi:hypothetical protein
MPSDWDDRRLEAVICGTRPIKAWRKTELPDFPTIRQDLQTQFERPPQLCNRLRIHPICFVDLTKTGVDSPSPNMKSDVYATGVALTALVESNALGTTESAHRRC